MDEKVLPVSTVLMFFGLIAVVILVGSSLSVDVSKLLESADPVPSSLSEVIDESHWVEPGAFRTNIFSVTNSGTTLVRTQFTAFFFTTNRNHHGAVMLERTDLNSEWWTIFGFSPKLLTNYSISWQGGWKDYSILLVQRPGSVVEVRMQPSPRNKLVSD